MSHLSMILGVLLVFSVSLKVNAATMVRTDNGHSFSVEFEGNKKTVTYIPHSYGPLSSGQEMTKREDLLFLKYELRTFCAPYQDDRDYKKVCIRAYNSLIQFAKEGLKLRQLGGIYIAPSETIPKNQEGFRDPYTDIFGYLWVNGKKPLVAKDIATLIKKRASHREKVGGKDLEVISGLRDLPITCLAKRKECSQALHIIRNLDAKMYQKINSKSWVTSIVIIGGADRLVSLEFDGDFSNRSLTISSEADLAQVSEHIDRLL